MCTLTFIPDGEDFIVGMNRDEQRSRTLALPPKVHTRDNLLAVYPSEPSGGTWIAANQSGIVLSLLNWYAVDSRQLTAKQKSRGDLIPELIFERELFGVTARLRKFDLAGVPPFRLVGISRRQRTVCEWRWDGHNLVALVFSWTRKHWFSSSISDTTAEIHRGATCTAAAPTANPRDPFWLDALHRSHCPASGPYSICVHRHDAATVSYTKVSFVTGSLSMAYVSGSPCEKLAFDVVEVIPAIIGANGPVSRIAAIF